MSIRASRYFMFAACLTLIFIAALGFSGTVNSAPGGSTRSSSQSEAKAVVPPTELFFSEYIEGSGNNKAVEIYNGTGASVDLGIGNYVLQIYSNGSATATTSINLGGVITNGDVLVYAHSSASLPILTQADDASMLLSFTGNDAVVLRKGGAIVDVIGQIGFDPGTEWGTGNTSTADNTLTRMATVCAGDPDGSNAFDPSIEWNGFVIDTFSNLGSHTASCSTAAPVITVNTTSFNGNFGNVAVGNASSASCYTVSGTGLTGDITVTAPAQFEVASSVFGTFSSSMTITQSGGTVTNANVCVRFRPTTTGAAGGNVTNASPGATTVNVPVTGTGITPGTLAFTASSFSTSEASGVVAITVSRTGGTDGAVTANLSFAGVGATGGASCTAGVDFIDTAQTVSFAAGEGGTKTYNVTICSDALTEGNENFFAALGNATGGATIGGTNPVEVTILAPTAAAASIAGRVSTANGAGIRGVTVTVSGGEQKEAATVITGSFGYYRFEGLQTRTGIRRDGQLEAVYIQPVEPHGRAAGRRDTVRLRVGAVIENQPATEKASISDAFSVLHCYRHWALSEHPCHFAGHMSATLRRV